MKQMLKRSLALVMALVLCICLLPAVRIAADATEFEYVYDSTGKYIYNWGTRGETATALSPNAVAFYTNNTYDILSAYAGGTGTSDAPQSALYIALQNLMKNNHSNETSYGATRDLYKYTDCQNNGGKISSFYSGKAIGPAWDSGGTWNREHTWPNSKGLGGNDENDIMMLRPTSVSENSSRGNTAYGQSSGYYNPNSEAKGELDLRGDVARIFLYVYVRWGNTHYAWGKSGVMESLDVLLEWMEADPVDTWELGRNDSVESITGTRNVFVDYPELGFLLFGAEIPTDMITPSGEAAKADEPSVCTHSNTGLRGQQDATCGQNGYSGDTYCADCDTLISAGSATPATGEHIYGDWTVTKEPTATESGAKERTCSTCSHAQQETLAPIGITDDPSGEEKNPTEPGNNKPTEPADTPEEDSAQSYLVYILIGVAVAAILIAFVIILVKKRT